MTEILSLLMLSFAMGLGIESVPDLLLGLANRLYAVSYGVSFAISLRILVHSLDPCSPVLLLVNTESAVAVVTWAHLAFGFLLNLMEDAKGVLGVFGHPGVEFSRLLGCFGLLGLRSHWSVIVRWESGAPSRGTQTRASNEPSSVQAHSWPLEVEPVLVNETLKKPFIKSNYEWTHGYSAKQKKKKNWESISDLE